jgi:hypothetical protein
MYLTKEDTRQILKNIQSFENDLNDVFEVRGYNLRNNLGRRNALISLAQERETADQLRKHFKEVIEDGAPGKPDIFIKDINKELECKITSGSKTKGSPSYSLQTDWETLCNKKSLDYMYIIAKPDFENFCVLFFEGLTPDDFFPPASGSRGKSRMNKTKAMKKVKCLVGDYQCHNDRHIENIQLEMREEISKHVFRMRVLNERYDKTSESATAKRKEISTLVDNQYDRFFKKWDKLESKLSYWKESPKRYKFIFDKI